MQSWKLNCMAAAALCAIAAAAQAQDGVTLYGVVDLGLQYTHTNEQNTNALEMAPGNYAGSRFGFKGSEEIAPGTSVGFVLESGFDSDTGAGKDQFFNRESQIYVKGDWGTLGAGRVGAFTSGMGSLSRYWDFDPFETAYLDAGIQATQIGNWDVHSNTLYYVSPSIAGFEFGAQYSFSGLYEDKETTGMADDNHFFNAFVRWDGATAKAILGAEVESIGHAKEDTTSPNNDRWSVKAAASWTPEGGPLTLFAGWNYYRNQNRFSDSSWDDDSNVAYDDSGRGLDANSFFLGARYTVGKASWLGQVQYLNGENKGAVDGAKEDSFERFVVSAGVHYMFSNSTMGYAAASWAKGNGLLDQEESLTNRVVTTVGVTHWF
ncbi:MAG: porin [Duodenibacillus sp.]